VFHLDADEEFTPGLAAECAEAATAGSAGLDGYLVAPKMIFEGRWVPHCTDFPAWQARFARRPGFRFIQAGHGQREAPEMRLGKLRANYLHDLSSGGRDEWLRKHRSYARAEAEAAASASAGGSSWAGLFSSDPLRRRRALKRRAAGIPCRSAARFIYQYFLRGGFLDGIPGLVYCRLLARYEGFVAEERRKLRRSAPAAP